MSRSLKVVIGLVALFALIIGFLQWTKLQAYGYNGLDLGIYTQAVWSLSEGNGFANSIHDPTYRGDHLELILVPLAGLYYLFPHPLTLLWAQTFFVAISGWLVFFLARRYLRSRWAVVATGMWLIHPLVYNPAMYEFHAMTFALPFLLASILAYEHRRWGWWLALLTIIALIREDLPLVVIGWAVLGAIDRIPWRAWVTAGIIGIGWYLVARELIIAANPVGTYKYAAFVGWLGDTPLEMVAYPFRHPVIFLKHIFQPDNWGTILGLLGGFGFLSVLRPKTLIPAALSLVVMMFIGASPLSVLKLHYVIPFTPFLLWSMLRALAADPMTTIFRRFGGEVGRVLMVILAFVGPLYLQAVCGFGEWPWKKLPDAEPTPKADVRSALALISPTDRVISTFSTLPQLANRPALYSLNYVYLGQRQYSETRYVLPTPIDAAIIDWKEFFDYQFLYKKTLLDEQTGEQRIREMLKTYELSPVASHGSVVVYRRGPAIEPLTERLGDSEATLTTTPVAADVQATQNNTAANLNFVWNVGTIPERPISIRLVVSNDRGESVMTTRLLGEGTYPATDWDANSRWRTRYTVTVPAGFTASHGRYELVELQGRYHLDRLRAFRFLERSVTSLSNGQFTIPTPAGSQ